MRSYGEQKRGGTGHAQEYLGYVCPPWVNNTSGNIQNKMGTYGSFYIYLGGDPSYDPPIVGFPFLVEVIRQVLTRTGHPCDLSAIENSAWSNLIVCQAFPLNWHMPYMFRDYNRALVLKHPRTWPIRTATIRCGSFIPVLGLRPVFLCIPTRTLLP